MERNVNVGVEEREISYIGKEMPERDFGEIYDGSGKLLMPAFYNAHAHSPMGLIERIRGKSVAAGLAEHQNFSLLRTSFTTKPSIMPHCWRWPSLFEFGIVSSSDMYYFCDAMVRAVEESGAKANISRSITSFAEGSVKNSDSYREAEELIRSCHGAAGEQDSSSMPAFHAEYTNTLQSMEEVADLAKKYNVNMHVHVSETKDEHENCKAKYRKTPARPAVRSGSF